MLAAHRQQRGEAAKALNPCSRNGVGHNGTGGSPSKVYSPATATAAAAAAAAVLATAGAEP